MNLIPKIAEMLGVEIGEEFRIKWPTCKKPNEEFYKFTKDGFYYYDQAMCEWVDSIAYVDLISDKAEVITRPFEPKEGKHIGMLLGLKRNMLWWFVICNGVVTIGAMPINTQVIVSVQKQKQKSISMKSMKNLLAESGNNMKALINLLAIVVTLNASAYTHSTNPTASGVMPQVGHCAVDKINGQWIPFGTVIRTSDGRVLTVTDRFGDGRSNCLDIFMASEDECWQFGRQNLRCEVIIP